MTGTSCKHVGVKLVREFTPTGRLEYYECQNCGHKDSLVHRRVIVNTAQRGGRSVEQQPS